MIEKVHYSHSPAGKDIDQANRFDVEFSATSSRHSNYCCLKSRSSTMDRPRPKFTTIVIELIIKTNAIMAAVRFSVPQSVRFSSFIGRRRLK